MYVDWNPSSYYPVDPQNFHFVHESLYNKVEKIEPPEPGN